MLRYGLAVLALMAMAGCESSTKVDPMARSQSVTPAQLAASAARAEYPQNAKASDEMRLVCMIHRENKTIRILNPGEQPMTNVKIWVNGEFVQDVDNIPAHGMVSLRREDFYNRAGLRLTQGNITVDRVELQTEGNLYRIFGPVYE